MMVWMKELELRALIISWCTSLCWCLCVYEWNHAKEGKLENDHEVWTSGRQTASSRIEKDRRDRTWHDRKSGGWGLKGDKVIAIYFMILINFRFIALFSALDRQSSALLGESQHTNYVSNGIDKMGQMNDFQLVNGYGESSWNHLGDDDASRLGWNCVKLYQHGNLTIFRAGEQCA